MQIIMAFCMTALASPLTAPMTIKARPAAKSANDIILRFFIHHRLSNISLELSNVSGFSGIASAERPIILKPLPLYSLASSERSPISCRQLGQVRVQIFTIVMRFLLNRLLPVLLPSSVVVSKLIALELLSYERDCFV